MGFRISCFWVMIFLCFGCVLPTHANDLLGQLPASCGGDVPKTCKKGIQGFDCTNHCDCPQVSPGDTRLSLVDANTSGFAFYRYRQPKKKENLKELCAAGIDVVVVLDGSGEEFEGSMPLCVDGSGRSWRIQVNRISSFEKPLELDPELSDADQEERLQVTSSFLSGFDRIIKNAKSSGKKVAVRCTKGFHRTGRAVAWYEMNHMNRSAEEASCHMGILLDQRAGDYRLFFNTYQVNAHRNDKYLVPQIRAMASRLKGTACTEKPEFCFPALPPSAEVRQQLPLPHLIPFVR
jgi:hypothetical protein